MPRVPARHLSDSEYPEIAAQLALQDAHVREAMLHGQHVRLAPPTYRVRGVLPLAIPSDAAPEGDGALRFLGADPDIAATEEAKAEYDEYVHLHVVQQITRAARNAGIHAFTSKEAVELFATNVWFNRHDRLMTVAERTRWHRASVAIWRAQSEPLSPEAQARVEAAVMSQCPAKTPKEAA